MSARLLESLATTDALAEVFSDAQFLSLMLQFEVALARAQARCGVIPAAAADQIAAAADATAFDALAIAREARASGTIAIPFVEQLRTRVHALDPESSTYVHWGATSQDVTDSVLVLCLARALPILAADHAALASALRRLSDAHANTVMLARTLMQPAPPITFGVKVAGWFASSDRSWRRAKSAWDEALMLQFGGPSGTLATLGSDAENVAIELARELNLAGSVPWHAHRDRLASLVASLGIYVAALGKMARDISLLMQVEIGEVSESGGGSSSMPHKRNPAGCAIALAAAIRVPGLVSTFLLSVVQEHERGLGNHHAEAPTLAAIVQSSGAALAAMKEVIERLHVDPERMRANIDRTHYVIVSERALVLLARKMGRDAAQKLVADAITTAEREERSFVDVLGPALSPDDLSLNNYVAAAERLRRELI